MTVYLAAGPAQQSTLTTVVLALLGSTVVAGVIAHILTGLRAGAAARRDRYAAAVRVLVARIEYPYRIRRRTDNEPATLAALASTGHDLQERLAEARAWIAAESRAIGEVLDTCLTELDQPFKQACQDAWSSPAVNGPEQMNLNGFGLGNQQALISRMEFAIGYRFGLGRLMPGWLVLRRLKRHGHSPSPGLAHPAPGS
ncbi:hypothetical protein [Kitasatospora mediocidica]|uniref:hypothetical protein n=1 Tax=Kitasatospora mediocidica TaxID=58352 RepID=UPI0012F817A0|nr:hypothetical protein [Kitasatospora mediocidica]